MENESQMIGSAQLGAIEPKRDRLTLRQNLLLRLRRSPESRRRFLDSTVSKALSIQLRQLRARMGWSQPELARKLGTSQNAISRLERPDYGKASLTTLKKLAAIYDVGLIVRFAPFSQLVNWESNTQYTEYGLRPDAMNPPSFGEEEASRALDQEPEDVSIGLNELLETSLGGEVQTGTTLELPIMEMPSVPQPLPYSSVCSAAMPLPISEITGSLTSNVAVTKARSPHRLPRKRLRSYGKRSARTSRFAAA